jgi:hypothetical protein
MLKVFNYLIYLTIIFSLVRAHDRVRENGAKLLNM